MDSLPAAVTFACSVTASSTSLIWLGAWNILRQIKRGVVSLVPGIWRLVGSGRVSLFGLSAWCTGPWRPGNEGKGKYVTHLTTKSVCLPSIVALAMLTTSARASPGMAVSNSLQTDCSSRKFLPLSGALAHAPQDCSTSMGYPRSLGAAFIGYYLWTSCLIYSFWGTEPLQLTWIEK